MFSYILSKAVLWVLDPAAFSQVTMPEHCKFFCKISCCKNLTSVNDELQWMATAFVTRPPWKKVVELNIYTINPFVYVDIT